MSHLLYIFNCIFLLILQFSANFCENLPENWVDPYDMSPSKDYLQYSDSLTSLHAHLDQNSETPNKEYIQLSDIYFRRTINMLLNSVHEDITDPDLYSGHLYFKIDAEKYKLLRSFADGTSSESFEKINKILEDILNKPTTEFLQNYLESWFHKCLNVILSREVIIAIVILCYAFVIFKLYHSNISSLQMFNFFLFNFLIFDFIFTWIHLYQKATSEQMSKIHKLQNIPNHCNTQDMNFFHFISYMLSSEDQCKNYYEVTLVDIFYKVGPATVMSEMFARTIQYPAKSIGQAFGDLVYGMYSAFPWPLNIIILPICFVFICIMTCIILSILTGKQMKFNFFHMISFSFGGESLTSQGRDTISGNNLEKLLNITQNQRQFIENIPIEQPITIKKKSEPIEIEQSKLAIEDGKKEKVEEEIIEEVKASGSGDHI